MMAMMKPLDDRIIVRPDDPEETLASGLVLPESAKDKPQRGEVLAVGPGARTITGDLVPIDVHPGDRVVYAKHAGIELDDEDNGNDDGKILVLYTREVIAVLDDEMALATPSASGTFGE
jgi:chaperonin GroES